MADWAGWTWLGQRLVWIGWLERLASLLAGIARCLRWLAGMVGWVALVGVVEPMVMSGLLAMASVREMAVAAAACVLGQRGLQDASWRSLAPLLQQLSCRSATLRARADDLLTGWAGWLRWLAG